jgi:hypothetical protein
LTTVGRRIGVLRPCDTSGMRRVAATILAALVGLTPGAPAAHAAGGAGEKPMPEPPRPGVTFAAVGDTMLGNSPELPADPGAYLDRLRRQLRGDVVFGNLEGTLTDVANSPKCGGPSGGDCFAFRAPPSYARHLAAAGFTVMNDANNHSYDFGQEGLSQTIAALHQAGIAQTGLPGEITVVKAGGKKVAVVGFAPYSLTASLLDLPAARKLIRRAARRAPIVVVAIHAGAEGSGAQHVTGAEEHYLGEDLGQGAVRIGGNGRILGKVGE